MTLHPLKTIDPDDMKFEEKYLELKRKGFLYRYRNNPASLFCTIGVLIAVSMLVFMLPNLEKKIDERRIINALLLKRH